MSTFCFIKSKLDGHVIDIQGASKKDGALLDAFPQKTTGNDNQLWEFVPGPHGFCFFKSKLSGNVIDILQAFKEAGAALDAWPQNPSATDNQLWKVVGGEVESYRFSLVNFQIKNTRSDNIFSTAKDTDYAALSVSVNGAPPKIQTQSMDDLFNGSYPTTISIDAADIAFTDTVVLSYHIVNSSQGEANATAYLTAVAEKIATAAAEALAKAAGDALAKAAGDALAKAAGDALGAALGSLLELPIPVPLIGSALSALAGFLVSDAWGIAFPDCDGPVASAVRVFSGAELHTLAAHNSITSTEDNPGVNSPDGCGSNSDYVVTWSVSAG